MMTYDNYDDVMMMYHDVMMIYDAIIMSLSILIEYRLIILTAGYHVI
jgi:hypothetical protein